MIQPAALPSFVLGGEMPETPAENSRNSANPAQFAGILALQQAGSDGASVIPSLMVAPALEAEPASAAVSTLPLTGKTLPPAPVDMATALQANAAVAPKPITAAPITAPIAASDTKLQAPATNTAATEPELPAETPAPPARQVAVHVRQSVRPGPVAAAKSAKAATLQAKADQGPESEAPAPGVPPLGIQLSASPAAPAQPSPADTRVTADEPRSAPGERATAAAKATAVMQPGAVNISSAAAPMLAPTVVEALPIIPAVINAPTDPAPVAAQVAGQAAARQAVTVNETAQPLSGAVARLRVAEGLPQAGDERHAGTPIAVSDPVSTPQPPLSAMPLGSDQPVTTAAPAVGEPRHDFSQLVDRLVAAREAAMPHPVHASLSHAEFGQVQLTFAHDTAGLTVAMASNDPDFARAVAAATPAERQSGANAGSSDTSGQPSARGDAQGSLASSMQNPSQAQTQSGQHQNSGEGRGGRSPDRPTVATATASESAAPALGSSGGRTGIFA